MTAALYPLAFDLKGRRFGRLLVLRVAQERLKGKLCWVCLCDCGVVKTLPAARLLAGNAKSCSCLAKEVASARLKTHGMSKTPPFDAWKAMRERCNNVNCRAYPNYGGRGITVCAEWQESFESFWRDMGPTYKEGLTLERVNNETGNYCKENCSWETYKVQNNNRRNNVWVTTPSGEMTVTQASEHFGIKTSTLEARIRKGVPNPFETVDHRAHPRPGRW